MKTRLTKEQCGRLVDLGLHTNKWTNFRNEEGFNETYEYFALADMLEILPKEIGDRNRIIESGPRGHFAYYIGINGTIGWKPAVEELIDALYELACWYYGEYLKSEEK